VGAWAILSFFYEDKHPAFRKTVWFLFEYPTIKGPRWLAIFGSSVLLCGGLFCIAVHVFPRLGEQMGVRDPWEYDLVTMPGVICLGVFLFVTAVVTTVLLLIFKYGIPVLWVIWFCVFGMFITVISLIFFNYYS
jgi:hypothetical protein